MLYSFYYCLTISLVYIFPRFFEELGKNYEIRTRVVEKRRIVSRVHDHTPQLNVKRIDDSRDKQHDGYRAAIIRLNASIQHNIK